VLPAFTTNTQNRAQKPPKTINLHNSDERENKHPTNYNPPTNTTKQHNPKKHPMKMKSDEQREANFSHPIPFIFLSHALTSLSLSLSLPKLIISSFLAIYFMSVN
jgi:hypothetical protein